MFVSNTRTSLNFFTCAVFSLISVCSQAQKKHFIIPTQFDWQNKENQYRISTILKTRLSEAGNSVFYSNEILPDEVLTNACNNFTIKVVRLDGAFLSKLRIDIADCQNQIVLQSIVGSSKDKSYDIAYREALGEAINDIIPKLKSIKRSEEPTNKSSSSTTEVAESPKINTVPNTAMPILAQRNSRGYSFLTDKGINIQLQQSSKVGVFLAFLDTQPAVAFYNNGKLLIEYYEGNKKIAVNYEVKLPE